jgi:mannosyl-3-phosphoglycerate phosphatase
LTSLVVVTDLDGTLLDEETYSFEAARPALAELERRGVPLVLCSSKTAAEIEPLRRELSLREPFIVENGGALVVPEDARGLRSPVQPRNGGALVVPFGTPRALLVEALREIALEAGLSLRGFAAMSDEEVAARTGLDMGAARRAGTREFDEPFVIDDTDEDGARALVESLAHRRGLQVTRGGRFFHLLGPHDKGKAVRHVLALYGRGVRSVGLGDAPNDLSLLEAVDEPILMPLVRGGVAGELARALPRAARAPHPGPRGWNEAVLDLLARTLADPAA